MSSNHTEVPGVSGRSWPAKVPDCQKPTTSWPGPSAMAITPRSPTGMASTSTAPPFSRTAVRVASMSCVRRYTVHAAGGASSPVICESWSASMAPPTEAPSLVIMR